MPRSRSATVTTPTAFWTLRTPRREIEPLLAAGYVERHPVAKDMYRVSVKGLEALESEE